MGTSERGWRGHLADTVEAARQAEAWNLAWIREDCDEAEWRAAESDLETKKAALVREVETVRGSWFNELYGSRIKATCPDCGTTLSWEVTLTDD